MAKIIEENITPENKIDESIYVAREELREYLYGLVICDYITRKDKSDILKDFDNWSVTATIGDSYYYDGNEYKLNIE